MLNINPKFSETCNVSTNEELFNEICNNFLKYISLLNILTSKLLFTTIILLSPVFGKNYENSPWKTMTTRGRKKKQEKIKNSNHHKSLENLSPNKTFEPPIKRSRGRARNNVLTDFKNTPSKTKRKTGRPRKQIIEDELPEIKGFPIRVICFEIEKKH